MHPGLRWPPAHPPRLGHPLHRKPPGLLGHRNLPHLAPLGHPLPRLHLEPPEPQNLRPPGHLAHHRIPWPLGRPEIQHQSHPGHPAPLRLLAHHRHLGLLEHQNLRRPAHLELRLHLEPPETRHPSRPVRLELRLHLEHPENQHPSRPAHPGHHQRHQFPVRLGRLADHPLMTLAPPAHLGHRHRLPRHRVPRHILRQRGPWTTPRSHVRSATPERMRSILGQRWH